MIFIQTMVHKNCILVRWICIQSFTLFVIEIKFLIVIFVRKDRSDTIDILFVWCILLQSLEVVMLMQDVIINIDQMGRVIGKAFMPSQECIINLNIRQSSIKYLIESDSSIRNSERAVLFLTFMEPAASPGSSEASVNSISMHTP